MALIKPLAPSLQKQHNALMFCLSKERRVRLQCKYARTASVPDNEGPILHEDKSGGVGVEWGWGWGLIMRSSGLPVVLLVSVATDWICICVFARRCRHLCNSGRLRLFHQSKSASSTDSQPAEERQGPSGGYASQGGAEAKRRRCDDKEPLAPHSYVSASPPQPN